jgi:hypothetical protein
MAIVSFVIERNLYCQHAGFGVLFQKNQPTVLAALETTGWILNPDFRSEKRRFTGPSGY